MLLTRFPQTKLTCTNGHVHFTFYKNAHTILTVCILSFSFDFSRLSGIDSRPQAWRYHEGRRRACGLAIVGRVTRGNFCSGEQYVALTYCARTTSTSRCCHATRRYRNLDAIAAPGRFASREKANCGVFRPRNLEHFFYRRRASCKKLTQVAQWKGKSRKTQRRF